jgi:hypothetical protein
MRFLLRVIVIFIVVLAALSMVRRILGLLAPLLPEQRQRSSGGGRLVKDPVCGTYIPAETALQAGGEFFCSEACRGKYLAT